MEHDPVVDADRDKPGEREQWFMRGRTLPGQATAALRYRAHLRKMQMRAARKAALQMQGMAALSAVSGSWTPLGPLRWHPTQPALEDRTTAQYRDARPPS